MRSFGYLRDGAFLVCACLYAINRWMVKPQVEHVFFHGYFNDLLLIPCALPVLLLMQRLLGLRSHDQVPTWGEIFLYLLVWTVLCEVLGPWITPSATGDPWDALSYLAGGVAAGWWWHRRKDQAVAGENLTVASVA